ncbi:beta-xylosidase [Rathayibacter sp. PhB185]|nr:beta-xylosidase [Rathayibacter sp. PhB186]ROS50743.1 beta-xylosidase [Rathayibacter sp. PhB185]
MTEQFEGGGGAAEAARGTYTNPLLNEDWPDPDGIRVGADYYLVTSSFSTAPGLPVLHSRDLVNWRLLARALPTIEPAEHFALPRHGAGVWAPAIRHRDGVFFLFVPDPDRGILVTTATDPAGPWSAPHTLLPGLGVIDPCPLWTDDGRAWMVFGWARSRSGVANRLSVVEISPDARRVLSAPVTVIDADRLPGYSTLEGPKLYWRDGWFWIFAPAGGVTDGWQSVFRSRSILGPYEGRIVLQQGDTAVNGPHQGAWVTTPEGEDWFLHFQDRGVFGRVLHLQPMRWNDAGWPVMGIDGEPVLEHPLPAGAVGAVPSSPARSDDWSGTALGLQWRWQANRPEDAAELRGDGFLRMQVTTSDLGSLRAVPSVLGQQLPGVSSVFSTSVRLDGAAADGAVRAGLVLLGRSYAWIGLVRTFSGTTLRVGTAADPSTGSGSVDERTVDLGPTEPEETVELRIRTTVADRFCSEAVAGLDYRRGGGEWVSALEGFEVTAGHWVGAELGLFACATAGTPALTGAVFGRVTVEPDRCSHGSPAAAGS